MKYKLSNGNIINGPRKIEIDGIIYTKDIFTKWSTRKLNSIGIYPINEQSYDKNRYKIISNDEKVIDGILHITYDLEEKTEYLESYKKLKYKEINVNRENVIESGIKYMNYTWDSDEISRNNLIGAVLGFSAGILQPDSETGYVIKWRTSDNQDINLTGEELIGLSTAMLNHVNISYMKSWEKKSLINNCNSVEEINSIEINNV